MFFVNHTELADGITAIVEVEGPLNSETSPDFDDYIKKIIENGFSFILLDLYKLNFISSEGIGATLLLHRRVNEKNGAVIFFNLNGEVSGLFDILGFSRIFNIADQESDAMEMLEELKKPAESKKEAIHEDTPGTERTPSHKKISAMELDLETGSDSDTAVSESLMPPDDEVEPFVIECLKCGSLVRIREKGEHICPFCEAEFSVTDDGKAAFKIDEINS